MRQSSVQYLPAERPPHADRRQPRRLRLRTTTCGYFPCEWPRGGGQAIVVGHEVCPVVVFGGRERTPSTCASTLLMNTHI
jgi:hypothetical protein